MKTNRKKLRRETRYTDTDTGQVIISHEKDIQSVFDEDAGYLWWHKKNFAKTFQTIEFPLGMNFADIGRLTVLSKHIWSNTNMLGYRGNGGVKPYTRNQIFKIIGLQPRQGYTWLTRMEQERIIKAISVQFPDYTEVQYYINPVFFYSSTRLSLNLYLIFREELDQHLPDWVKKQFGILADKEIGP